MKQSRILALALLVGTVGCEAAFKDLSSASNETMEDGGVDGGVDAGSDSGLPDAGDMDMDMDAGPSSVVAMGPWEGESGYSASGTVSVVEANGQRRLEFDEDFDSSGVPGPFVVVSTRDNLSNGVSAVMGDVTIAALMSRSGAQSYDVPSEVGEFNYVWVYCQPFTVEVARAELTDVP